MMLFLVAMTALSAFVQGVIGMGFALIMVPILSFCLPEALPVTLLVIMLPLNAYVALREWSALDVRGASWVTAGRLAGALAGMAILVVVSPKGLSIFIGVSTLLAAGLSLAAPSFKPGVVSLLSAGLVTGVTETATGIGGPPLALVYQHEPAPTLRATIATCFFVGQVISLVVLAVGGRVEVASLIHALYLVPAVIVGALASRRVHTRLNGPALRTGVMVFAIAAGIMILIDAWW